MCRNLVLLAIIARQQTIFTCEQGTVHITHHKATLCLTNLLTNGGLAALAGSSIARASEVADQHVELWIGSGGIRLSRDAYFALTALMRAALRQLNRLPESLFRRLPRKHSLN